jgi:hypothetical protein
MAYDLLTKKRSSRNWALGASFTTSTDDVELRMKDLIVDVNNLNNDITQSWFPKHRNEDSAQRFVAAWIAWRDQAYAFVKSWKEGGFFHVKLAWNYMDDTNQKISELATWRERWERLSGESSTAPSTKAPPKDEPSSGGLWKWLAIAGVGAAGGLLIAKKLGA